MVYKKLFQSKCLRTTNLVSEEEACSAISRMIQMAMKKLQLRNRTISILINEWVARTGIVERLLQHLICRSVPAIPLSVKFGYTSTRILLMLTVFCYHTYSAGMHLSSHISFGVSLNEINCSKIINRPSSS